MRKISDKKELMKLCSFITMGDGGVYFQTGNKNCAFIMNMKAENKDYIQYCADILDNITSTSIRPRKDYSKDGCIRHDQLRLTSSNHPFFTQLRERIYFGTYKGLDPHAFKLFDWECLAILFMSDGCSCLKKGYVDVTLNMKRLSYGDQLFLKQQLKEKLDLEWNINKQNKYFYLRLRNKDVIAFYEGISPYILPSFRYKILDVVPSTFRGGDIVCTIRKRVELGRNDLALQLDIAN